MQRIISFDYSMTSPAATILAADSSFINSKLFFLTNTKKYIGKFHNILGGAHDFWTSDMDRYERIAKWFFYNIEPTKEDLVFIEDYSLGSKGKTYQIHENTAILKYFLYKNQIKYVTVPPTVIKKFATGKGNSDKDKIYKCFLGSNPDIREWMDVDKTKKIGNPISDIVDSYYIALYGKSYVLEKESKSSNTTK